MDDELKPGEIKVVAKTKLMLNWGRLVVLPGQVVILGDEDKRQGVNVDVLLRSGAVVPYQGEEQALEIGKEGDEASRKSKAVKVISTKLKRRR